MNQKLFDDIPGVGEILIYQIDEKIGEKKQRRIGGRSFRAFLTSWLI